MRGAERYLSTLRCGQPRRGAWHSTIQFTLRQNRYIPHGEHWKVVSQPKFFGLYATQLNRALRFPDHNHRLLVTGQAETAMQIAKGP